MFQLLIPNKIILVLIFINFKQRIKQLGENPKNIHNIGSLGVLAIDSTKKIRKLEILKKLKINGDYILVAIHPETINDDNNLIIKSLFKVLSEQKNYHIVFTYPNSDPGNEKIIKNIQKFLNSYPTRATFITSAGREIFINLVRHAEILIGNSSSCVIEAPAVGTKSVLIGKRQDGRPLAATISKADICYTSINHQVRKILKEKNLASQKYKLPYKAVNSLPKILKILSTIPLDGIKLKKFYDQ